MSAFIGVNGKAQEITNIYVGVNGKARQVVAGFVGVNGKAKQFFVGEPEVFSFKAGGFNVGTRNVRYNIGLLGKGTFQLIKNSAEFNYATYRYFYESFSANTEIPLSTATIAGRLKRINLGEYGDGGQYDKPYSWAVSELLTPMPSGCDGQSFEGFLFNSKIQSIPQGFFTNCPNSTNFKDCFRGCSSLTSIPQTLFDACTKATDFSYCFADCTALTGTAPELWDTTKFPYVTAHEACFRGCTGLSNYANIPADWK